MLQFEEIPPAVRQEFEAAIQVGQAYLTQAGVSDHWLQTLTSEAISVDHWLLTNLSDVLYQDWYIAPTSSKAPFAFPFAQNFVEVLRAAHAGSYDWETGWRAVKVSTAGRVIAVRGNEQRLLTVTDYVCQERPGLPVRPGATLDVVTRWDSLSLSPGFWVTKTPSWTTNGELIVRLYWNIYPEGTPCLVQALTRRVEEMDLFCLKVPLESDGYKRLDAVVLYLPASQFGSLTAQIQDIYSSVADYLHPEVPKLTQLLAPGLGLAENPPNNQESFGLHRCRLIARGLLTAKGNNQETDGQILEYILQEFLGAGIPWQRPYLNSLASPNYRL